MARSRRSAGEAKGANDAGAARTAAPEAISFEAALAELETVVARLESGDMPLEQALEAFEAGIQLSRRCGATLDAAERRIEILMAERGDASPRIEPFETGSGRADAGRDEDDLERDSDDPDR
ncbi:MAG: exodeoxyribonuclease VII small subunit [Myxococcota bacterium]